MSREQAPQTTTAPSPERRVFFGWYIVAAMAFRNFYSSGTWFYGFSAFFTPIVDEFRWSRAVTAFGFALFRLESGIEGPIIGYLADRYGPRRFMIVGVAIMGIGYILISMTDSLGWFYAAFIVTAIGNGTGFGPTAWIAVNNWFIRMRSRAFGLFTFGAGLSGILVPVLVWVISTYGWRQALVFCAFGMWLVGIPTSLVARHKPEQYGYLPDGDQPRPWSDPPPQPSEDGVETSEVAFGEIDFTVSEALRTQAFWFIVAVGALSGVTLSSLVVHEIPYLITVGFSAELAGLVVTGMTVISLVGRLVFGYLGDFMDKRHVYAVALALQGLGVLIFASISETWHIIPFLLVFSPGYGGPIPVRLALVGQYFGRQAFGIIYGLMMFLLVWTNMTGPVFAGWVYDVMGSYRLAFLIYSGMTLLAIPFLLLVRPPRRATSDRLRAT